MRIHSNRGIMAKKRNTETKAYIKTALTKLLTQKKFEDITISDLTKTAGINRGTFYLHYKDKYDMMDQFKNETLDNLSCILNDTAINTNTEKVLIETLTYLKNDFDFIFAISQSSYVNLPQTIKDFTYRILLNIPDSKNTISNHYGVPYRYAIEVYLASIESLISFWVMNGAQESPEEMTSIILKMLYIDKYFNKTSL